MFGMVYSFSKIIKIIYHNTSISEKEDEETFRMEISGLLNEMGKYCTVQLKNQQSFISITTDYYNRRFFSSYV